MKYLRLTLLPFVLILVSCATIHQNGPDNTATGTVKSGLKMEELLMDQIHGVDGKEVFVTKVTIPPNTTLPRHWHPGEEFAYVLDGSIELWQKGKPSIHAKKGQAIKVPFKQVHTAITKREGASVVVFRVHEKGQPQRVLVE